MSKKDKDKETKVKTAAPENKDAAAAIDETKVVEAPGAEVFDPNKKHKVVMLGSAPGVDVGEIHPKMYLKGEKYEIGASLYNSFKSDKLVD